MLSWIKSQSNKMKTFVSHRIAKIHSYHFKKASKSRKIFLKCHAFLKIFKKASHSQKKGLAAIAALPQWPVLP
jgi:hypothetical protein